MSKEKIEEIDINTFMALEDVPEGFKRAKIDYDAVLDSIVGKPMSVAGIRKVMLANASEGKDKVYYSEVTGFLTRLSKHGYKVDKRSGAVIYYLVTAVPKA